MSMDYKAWWLDHAEHFECEDPIVYEPEEEAWYAWNYSFSERFGPFFDREEAEDAVVNNFYNG